MGGGVAGGSVTAEDSASSDDMQYESSGTGRTERSGDRRRKEQMLGELGSLAPIPLEPSLFEPGSTYYRGYVTFTIEIIDQSKTGGNASGEGS